MQASTHLAKHFRDVFFGGNWTSVSLFDTLKDVSWQQANAKVDSLNTIVALTYHISYYISAVMKVLEGGPLDASDKFSFDHPPVQSQDDWDQMLAKIRAEAEQYAALVEQLPESKLWEDFAGGKYGNYYRNLQGVTEHTHYHLGQIAVIKKLLLKA